MDTKALLELERALDDLQAAWPSDHPQANPHPSFDKAQSIIDKMRDANLPKHFDYDQKNVCVALDGDWAGWVFVRHLDGTNWTSAAKLTDMTFRMVLRQQSKELA